MSTSVHDLIGQIIDPGVRAPVQAAPRGAAPASEPLSVLIGRTIGPPAEAGAPRQPSAEPAPEVITPPVAM